jgi:hypothetical protein
LAHIVRSADNSDAIAEKVGNKFDKIMNKYDKEHIFELNGQLYSQKGANYKGDVFENAN